MKNLQLPISEEVARSLKLGEIVTVSGLLFTGRSRFHIRAIENDVFPPLDYDKINCFFHLGPVMSCNHGQWEVVSYEPTSSIRFERYGADVIRKFKLRTLIGKTTMGQRSAEALRDIGGVYLSKIGLSGNALRDQVKKIHAVYFLEELGKTEATWIYEVAEFGPFFVAIDANGNNYFSELDQDVARTLPEIEKQLGIPANYQFTDVNAEA